MVFEWGTFSSGWSLGWVLFPQGGLWVGYFFFRVVFGWGAFSSGWPFSGMLFCLHSLSFVFVFLVVWSSFSSKCSHS